MRRLVKAIDARLRRRQGIVPYSNDPECLLRISSGRADADRTLSDGTQIRRGDPICIIHFWNEHMPQIPPKGADIAWALQFRRQLRHSFRLLAQHLQEAPAAERVQAITGELSFGSAYRFGRFEAIMERWGFDVVSIPEPTQLWPRFDGSGKMSMHWPSPGPTTPGASLEIAGTCAATCCGCPVGC